MILPHSVQSLLRFPVVALCLLLTLFEQALGKEAMQTLIARATTDLNTYTTDPALLDTLRREMAAALESASLSQRPSQSPADK